MYFRHFFFFVFLICGGDSQSTNSTTTNENLTTTSFAATSTANLTTSVNSSQVTTSITSSSKMSSTTSTKTTTITTVMNITTEAIVTTLDDFHSYCGAALPKPDYEANVCNCNIDPCLQEIFDMQVVEEGYCPEFARYPVPTITTEFNWATLFMGEPRTISENVTMTTTTVASSNNTTANSSVSTNSSTNTNSSSTNIAATNTTTLPMNSSTTTIHNVTATTTTTTTAIVNVTTKTTVGNTTTTSNASTVRAGNATSITTAMSNNTNTTTRMTNTTISTLNVTQTTTWKNSTGNSTLQTNTTNTGSTTTTKAPYLCNTQIPWGVNITNPGNYSGRLCSCVNFTGDEMKVTAIMYRTWQNQLSNSRILETSDFLKVVAKEMESLVRAALGNQFKKYVFIGIHQAPGNLIGVDFTVSVMQSNILNYYYVQKNLTTTFEVYRSSQDPGVFGASFPGYEKHNYVNATALRQFPAGLYVGKNSTVSTTPAPEPDDPYAALMVFLPIGLLLIIGVLILICLKGDACLPKAWCF